MEFKENECACLTKGKDPKIPSLRNICFRKVRCMIRKLELSASSLQSLLPAIVQELYESLFYCSSSHKKKSLSDETAKKKFEIWLLFFDKEKTKRIDLPSMSRDFCLELITYLERNVTCLESIEMYYNWILNRVYIDVFKNLPHLKNLTVIGYLSNAFLNIISDQCQLESLEIRSDNHEVYNDKRYGRSSSIISKFFKSQKNSLQKVDLTQMFCSGFYSEEKVSSPVSGFRLCLEDFQSIQCIKSLTISSDMFMLITHKMTSLNELVVNFKESTKLTSRGNIFESILDLCTNLRTVVLLNLELYPTSYSSGDADGFLCEDVFIEAIQGKLGHLLKGISSYLFGKRRWIDILELTPCIETASFELETDESKPLNDFPKKPNQITWDNLKSLYINAFFSKCDFHRELQPILINSPRLEHCNLLFLSFTSYLNDADFLLSLKHSSLRAMKSMSISLGAREYGMTAKIVFEFLSRSHSLRAVKNFRPSFCMNPDEIDIIHDMVRTIGFEGCEAKSLFAIGNET